MNIKKQLCIFIILLIILGISAFAYNIINNKTNINAGEGELMPEAVSITPPPGGLNPPIIADLTEDEINKIPVYGEPQEDSTP